MAHSSAGKGGAVGVEVMDVVVDLESQQLLRLPTKQQFRSRVHVGQPALNVEGEETLAHAGHDCLVELREALRALLALAPAAPFLGLPLRRRLQQALELAPLQPAQSLRLLEQIDEDGRLGPQDGRDDRLDEVIDGAQLVGAFDREAACVVGGEEDDRGMAGALAAADELGGGEAVQTLHLNVEEDDGKVFLQKQAQGVVAGSNRNQVLTQVRQDGFQGQEVGRLVVNQKNVARTGRFRRRRSGSPAWPASTVSGLFHC